MNKRLALWTLALTALTTACTPEAPTPLQAAAAPVPFEQQCELRLPNTRVEVTALPGKLTYDFSRSMAGLTNSAARQRTLGQVVLGLTESKVETNMAWGNNLLLDPEGKGSCMRPTLRLTLNIPQVVSVAREFPRGSCAYNDIMRHELLHVQANQAHAEATALYLQKELTQFFGNKVFYGDEAELLAQLREAITQSWLPLVKTKMDEVNRQHNLIDSPAEYAKNEFVCGGAISREIRQAGLR